MNDVCIIYIIPPLAGINVKIDPVKSGWDKIEDPLFERCSEYKKQISYNNKDWLIIFRKYDTISAVSFVIKGHINECANTDNFRDIDAIFYQYKSECGAIGTRFIIKYIIHISNIKCELLEKKKEFCYLFTERSHECELNRIDILNYNLIFNYDSTLTTLIVDNLITLLVLSEITYHLEPYFFKDDYLMEKLNINQDDLVREFWLCKFHILNKPISQAFPLFFNNKMSLINNLLSYRNINLQEVQLKSSKEQEDLLTEIGKTESCILYLTVIVSLDVIYKILSDIIPLLISPLFEDYEAVFRIIFVILAALISYILFVLLKKKEGR